MVGSIVQQEFIERTMSVSERSNGVELFGTCKYRASLTLTL